MKTAARAAADARRDTTAMPSKRPPLELKYPLFDYANSSPAKLGLDHKAVPVPPHALNEHQKVTILRSAYFATRDKILGKHQSDDETGANTRADGTDGDSDAPEPKSRGKGMGVVKRGRAYANHSVFQGFAFACAVANVPTIAVSIERRVDPQFNQHCQVIEEMIEDAIEDSLRGLAMDPDSSGNEKMKFLSQRRSEEWKDNKGKNADAQTADAILGTLKDSARAVAEADNDLEALEEIQGMQDGMAAALEGADE